MSALDVIPIPGHSGMYARRAFVEAWQAAGSPPLNSAGRLYKDQKYFWDGWAARLPGFNPADNPDDESQRLAHVRFVAGDIDPTPDRIRRLTAAGLIRPYAYEPWHWELPNVRQYAIVRSIPNQGGGATPAVSTPLPERRDMSLEFVYVSRTNGSKQLGFGIDGNGNDGYGILNTSLPNGPHNPFFILASDPNMQETANGYARTLSRPAGVSNRQDWVNLVTLNALQRGK